MMVSYQFQDPSGNKHKLSFELDQIINSIKSMTKTKDPYLNYDIDYIRGKYPKDNINWLMLDKHDQRIFSPYEIIFDYRKSNATENWGTVKFSDADYEFPHILAEHKKSMVSDFQKAGKLFKGNLPCVRITDFNISPSGIPEYTIQKALYFDQVGTNQTVDYHILNPISIRGSEINSIREWDKAQANVKNELPAFNQSKLSNTIGVAVGIVAKDSNGKVLPFQRKRKKTVAVYEGQWHLPFSFSLAWPTIANPNNPNTLADLVMQDWGHELVQELGLEKSDFKPPIPIAFCRDFVRAGKPQFFFQVESRIEASQLIKKVKSDKTEYKGRIRKKNQDFQESYSPELVAFSILTHKESS